MRTLSSVQKLSREEEKSLWKRYKEDGETEARQKLIEQYQPLVFREAMRYTLQETIVLDLIQEGTVGLMEAAEKYDPSQGVAFSLYAVHRVRGRIRDFLCANKNEVLVDETEKTGNPFESVAGTDPDAFDIADRNLLTRTVHEAMKRLPGREKDVIFHLYLNEQTATETADAMSISTAYVHRLQKQGIRRLRGMLSMIMHDRK